MTKININIVYAENPHYIWQENIQMDHDATVIKAINQSGFFQEFPYFSYNNIQYGIYGLLVNGNTVLKNNDRIEIYRELVFDPMQSRRRRAKLKQTSKNKNILK